MQLFSADATMFFVWFFCPRKLEKPASKVAHNRPKGFFFQYCQPAQIQPKSQLLFHKNLPPRDFFIMTLGETFATKLTLNQVLGNLAKK